MGILDEDVVRVRESSDIVAVITQHTQLKKVGTRWSGPLPVPQREVPVVLGQPGRRPLLLLRLPGVGRRHHVRPRDRAPRLRRRHRVAGRQVRHPAPLHREGRGREPQAPGPPDPRSWSRPSTGTTTGCCPAPTPAARAATCAAGGFDREMVDQFRIGWAPESWDALVKGAEGPDRPRGRHRPRPA